MSGDSAQSFSCLFNLLRDAGGSLSKAHKSRVTTHYCSYGEKQHSYFIVAAGRGVPFAEQWYARTGFQLV